MWEWKEIQKMLRQMKTWIKSIRPSNPIFKSMILAIIFAGKKSWQKEKN
jgi:hypothetical protein